MSQGEKKQVAVRILIRQKAELEREATENGVSRSEYIRSILADRHRPEQLEQTIGRKDNRIAELEQQLAERSRVEEKIEDLPEKIRGEMSYSECRQRMLDNASPMERLKWRITGVPVEESNKE